jgi:hypothetical protein
MAKAKTKYAHLTPVLLLMPNGRQRRSKFVDPFNVRKHGSIEPRLVL